MTMNTNKLKKNKSNLVLLLVILLMAGALTVGDMDQMAIGDENGTTEYAEAIEAVEADTGSGNGTIDIMADGKIKSVSFVKDMDIREVLRFMGVKYNKNIVPSPKVSGPITVRTLYDVTFDEAMDAILGDTFQWEQKGNIIEVYPKEDKNRMRYKVFSLSYISADEAKKLVAPVLSAQAQIGTSTAAETGVPTGETITQANGGDTMAAQDTLVVYDYPERIAQAEDVIKSVDIKPRQVLVEATILSVLLTEGMELGVDLNFMSGELFSTSENDRFASDSAMAQIGGGTIKGGAPMEVSGFANFKEGLKIGITTGDLAGFINALETTTDTTILANPKILAVNKQLGQVYIGTKIGYRSSTTQNDTSTTQQVEFLDTGTKLSFRPYIGNDGYIRMDIAPKDSSGELKANEIPDESSTEISTNVIVKDGETIVIGGLFRDVVIKTKKQVPFFGDLPLIGAAFSSTADTVKRQEVIVLLTPHIIEDSEDTQASSRKRDIRIKKQAADDSLHSLNRVNFAQTHYVQAVKFYLDGDFENAKEEVEESLRFRPTYLEALRLKEKLIGHISDDPSKEIDSLMIEEAERVDTFRWLRR